MYFAVHFLLLILLLSRSEIWTQFFTSLYLVFFLFFFLKLLYIYILVVNNSNKLFSEVKWKWKLSSFRFIIKDEDLSNYNWILARKTFKYICIYKKVVKCGISIFSGPRILLMWQCMSGIMLLMWICTKN